jgi:hypothetical protein
MPWREANEFVGVLVFELKNSAKNKKRIFEAARRL